MLQGSLRSVRVQENRWRHKGLEGRNRGKALKGREGEEAVREAEKKQREKWRRPRRTCCPENQEGRRLQEACGEWCPTLERKKRGRLDGAHPASGRLRTMGQRAGSEGAREKELSK